MDGYEATTQMREMGIDSLIVGLTANVLEEDGIEFMGKGLDDLLGKPLIPEVFKKLEENVMGIQRPRFWDDYYEGLSLLKSYSWKVVHESLQQKLEEDRSDDGGQLLDPDSIDQEDKEKLEDLKEGDN